MRHQAKRHCLDNGDLEPLLLPGLPDHLALLCLSPVPPSLLFAVCRSWRRLIYSPSFPPFLSLYAVLSIPPSSIDPDPVCLCSFDPVSGSWSDLPSPPPNTPLRSLRVRHPSFLSRPLPVQSVAAGDRLVLLAATADDLLPAFPHPLSFHPVSGRWDFGPSLRFPRRWCAAGSAAGFVYLASGVSSAYRSDVARSAERWDPAGSSGRWTPIAALPDGRFSREAVDAVAGGGKLCMVNVRGRGPKEGAVYDIERDAWEEMPPGMLAGWTGPVAAPAEGKKGEIYAVDELSGEVREYLWGEDTWQVVAKRDKRRQGAAVATAGGGKICIVAAGGDVIEVLDVTRPGRAWAVELPEGRRVIALHVLPRMSREEL